MPAEWVLSMETPQLTHDIIHLDLVEELGAVNYLMRLETFMSVANRNVDVFNTLNECLMTLYSVTSNNVSHNVVPATYTFFRSEFGRYSSLSESNDEVARILSETCTALETNAGSYRREDITLSRKSIVDPALIKMRGQKTNCDVLKCRQNSDTPANENDRHVPNGGSRENQKGSNENKTQTYVPHLSECRAPRPNVPRHSPAGKHTTFERLHEKLFDRGKLACYLVSFARRESPAAVQSLIARVKSFDFLPEGSAMHLVQSMENVS